MPFSLTDTTGLPANIKGLPAKRRRQWVHVFNSAYAKATGNTKQKESAAYAQANGVVLRNKEADTMNGNTGAPNGQHFQVQPFAAVAPQATHVPTPTSILPTADIAIAPITPPTFVGGDAASRFGAPLPSAPNIQINVGNKDMYDGYGYGSSATASVPDEQPSTYLPFVVQQHQVDPDLAGYVSLSPKSDEACANCQWMVTPDGCIKVGGVISPTGWCKLWDSEELYDDDDTDGLPVTITNAADIAAAMKEADDTDGAAQPRVSIRTFAAAAAASAARTRHNPLPDSAYAFVDEKGGGHFRIDDEKHVRLAVQLLSTSPYGPKARAKVMAAAKKYGIKVSNKEWTGIPLVDKLYASLFGIQDEPDAHAAGFQLRWITNEAGEEQLRWFGTWTNVFKDRSGTIIPTYSHKEYVDYVDREGAYPELLYWHVIGTEFGKADWMEYDGMLTHAAGYVYPDDASVQLAIRLSEQPDMGMSHGTIYVEDPLTGDVLKHRTFELSALPIENANNLGTVWFTLKGDEGYKGDDNMTFSDKKKASLKELMHLDDSQVAALESQTDAFRQHLVDQKIEWKSDDDIANDPAAVVSQATLAEAVMVLAKTTKEGFEQVRAELSEAKTTATTALTAANKSRDDIIADAVRPASAAAADQARGTGTYVATKATDNVTGQANGLTSDQAEKDREWSDQFMGLVFGDEPVPAAQQ